MGRPKISRWLNRAAQMVVFLGMSVAFWQQLWATGLACMVILGLMNIPLRVHRGVPPILSPNTRALMSLLLFAWLFLGELLGYFERFAWWDLFMHSFAGALIALLGVRMAKIMTIGTEPRPTRYAFSAAFGFSLTLAIGVLWEVVEFTVDFFFGTNLVKPMFDDPSGLTDTMFDLLADGTGALVACCYALLRFYRGERYGTR